MHKKELNVITLSVLSIVFLLLIGYALADLPIQGNHDGTWGTHLNDWLEIGHNLTSGAADNFTDASIVAADIGFRNITAALMGTGAVNSTHIADRSIIAILLGTGVINATHIGDRNVTAANIGTGLINATHIGDRNITAANMGADSVNSTNLADGNVSTSELANGLIVNASQVRVGNASMAAAPNITGIFVNSTVYDITVNAGTCTEIYVNMSGLPGNVPCLFSFAGTTNSPVDSNLTYNGMNSTNGNARARFCNANAASISLEGAPIRFFSLCIVSY